MEEKIFVQMTEKVLFDFMLFHVFEVCGIFEQCSRNGSGVYWYYPYDYE